MPTESEFRFAARRAGQIAGQIRDERSKLITDGEEVTISGAQLVDVVDRAYDSLVSNVGLTAAKADQIESDLLARADECAKYTEQLREYQRVHAAWSRLPDAARATAPEPQEPVPWESWIEPW